MLPCLVPCGAPSWAAVLVCVCVLPREEAAVQGVEEKARCEVPTALQQQIAKKRSIAIHPKKAPRGIGGQYNSPI